MMAALKLWLFALILILNVFNSRVYGFDFSHPKGDQLTWELSFSLQSQEFDGDYMEMKLLEFNNNTAEYRSFDWYCNTFELNAKGYAELMDIKDVKGVHALESKAKLLSQAFTQDAVFRYREKGKIEEVKCAMRIASALTGYGKCH